MPADAVLYNCMEAIKTAVQAIDLAGIADASVYIQKIPDAENKTLPCVLISATNEDIPPTGGTNNKDDVTYNIVISLIAADNNDQNTNHEQYLEWRQKVRRTFNQKRLSGVSENVICYVRPLAIIHPDAWNSNLLVSMLAVQCVCREPRTP